MLLYVVSHICLGDGPYRGTPRDGLNRGIHRYPPSVDSDRPLVTVLVPAYNAASTVETAVRSALDQTYREVEVLVVDDGSTDATADVVRAIDDPRLRLIRQANRGVAAARNQAIWEARGTFLAPLDADDVWYPGKLAAQVERMEAGGPGMGMVYSWWVRIDGEGQIRGSSFPCRAEGAVALGLLYANFIGNASVPLYRRDAVVAVGGYDASLRARGAQGCEDWDLSLRVAARHATGVAPGHLVGYRQGAATMSSDAATMARSYYGVVDRLRQSWRGVPPQAFRWSDANFATYLASQSYAGGRYGDALRWAWHALRTDWAYGLAPYSWRMLGRSLARIVGGRALDRALADRPPVAPTVHTRASVAAEWAGTRSAAPWSRSWKPFDAVRTRRWRRLATAAPPVPAPALPLAIPARALADA